MIRAIFHKMPKHFTNLTPFLNSRNKLSYKEINDLLEKHEKFKTNKIENFNINMLKTDQRFKLKIKPELNKKREYKFI